MEGEDKGEAISIEVLRVPPLLGQKGAEDVTLCVLDHENRVILVGYLVEECDGAVAVAIRRVEQAPL